jgi:hypothetical protein
MAAGGGGAVSIVLGGGADPTGIAGLLTPDCVPG